MEIINRGMANTNGYKQYFTGKPCVNGHIATRYTSSGACTACDASTHRTNYIPDRHRIRDYDRKCEKMGGGGTHTVAEEEIVLATQNYLCAGINCRNPKAKLTVDHKVPMSRGGSNNIDNIQFLCRPCNIAKGSKTNDEWLGRKPAETKRPYHNPYTTPYK